MYVSQDQALSRRAAGVVPSLLSQLATVSTRPRYAFMLLNLLAEIAEPTGSAGPYVQSGNRQILLRDWLCDALTPMGSRDPKRVALVAKVQAEFRAIGKLPDDIAAAQSVVADEVCLRVRAAGKANLSRAVTELVRAGLLERHYEGYRVDHKNRGAQRHAVYTLAGAARQLLRARSRAADIMPRQAQLPLL